MEREKLLIKISQILEKLNIPYLVTGGIAVAAWGRVRATFDIDIVIEIEKTKISSLVQAIKTIYKTGYIDKEMAEEAIETEGEFNFIQPETGLKVDFWIKKENPFSKNEFARRVPQQIGEYKVYFVSPEDLILQKLQWYKMSEVSKHLEDIESILKISKIDLKYIKEWIEKQSTKKLFEEILKK